VLKHWTITLVEHVLSNLDDQVGADTENVVIKRGVMEFTQSESVTDPGLSPRMSIGKDMRGIEELLMPQTANRAALSIRLNHSHSEALLM